MAELIPQEVYELFYANPLGRKVWEGIKDNWYYRTSYVPGQSADHTHFLLGQRDVIESLMSIAHRYARPEFDGDPVGEMAPYAAYEPPLESMNDFAL